MFLVSFFLGRYTINDKKKIQQTYNFNQVWKHNCSNIIFKSKKEDDNVRTIL